MDKKEIFRRTGEEVYSFFDAFREGEYLDAACSMVDAMAECMPAAYGPDVPEEVYLIPLFILNQVSGMPVLAAAPEEKLLQAAGLLGHVAESYGFSTDICMMPSENRARLSMAQGFVICPHGYFISDLKKITDPKTKRFPAAIIFDSQAWEKAVKKSYTEQWEYGQVKKILSDASFILDGVHSPYLAYARQAEKQFDLFWDSLVFNSDETLEYTSYDAGALSVFLHTCGKIYLPDLPDMYDFYSGENEKLLHETDESLGRLLVSMDGILDGSCTIYGLFPGESRVISPNGYHACFAIQVVPVSAGNKMKWGMEGRIIVKIC